MTSHRIIYEGPSGLAVRAATLLADTEGVELTSAGKPQRPDGRGGPGDPVRLTMTLEGTTDAVAAALLAIGDGLPTGARMTIDSQARGEPG